MAGRASRIKGHSYERKIVKELRELGFTECCTTRSESRRLDDAKVDIMNCSIFQIQCKAQERGVNHSLVLDSMPKDTNINCLFHKQNRKPETVSLLKEDFYEIIKMLKSENII